MVLGTAVVHLCEARDAFCCAFSLAGAELSSLPSCVEGWASC